MCKLALMHVCRGSFFKFYRTPQGTIAALLAAGGPSCSLASVERAAIAGICINMAAKVLGEDQQLSVQALVEMVYASATRDDHREGRILPKPPAGAGTRLELLVLDCLDWNTMPGLLCHARS